MFSYEHRFVKEQLEQTYTNCRKMDKLWIFKHWVNDYPQDPGMEKRRPKTRALIKGNIGATFCSEQCGCFYCDYLTNI